jgi:phosphopantetheinyl transferase
MNQDCANEVLLFSISLDAKESLDWGDPPWHTAAVVRHLVQHQWGLDLSQTAMVRTATGKPHFPETNIHFSISHSLDKRLVALSRGGPLGVDVECLQKPALFFERLAQRFLDPREQAFLQALDAQSRHSLWVLREALCKCTGRSIWQGLTNLTLSGQSGLQTLNVLYREDPWNPEGLQWRLGQWQGVPWALAMMAKPPFHLVTRKAVFHLEETTPWIEMGSEPGFALTSCGSLEADSV